MKIIDFFNFAISEKKESSLFDLNFNNFKKYIDNLDFKKCKHYQIPIFDSLVINNIKFNNFFLLHKKSKYISFVYLPNLNSKKLDKQIIHVKRLGFKGIVLHPYLQKIDNKFNKKIRGIAKLCEQHNLFICVCAAYGSKNIYNVYPLNVVAELANNFSGKIIIVHSGGLKILEAMLLAESFSNIYLDTSFSLFYWKNSNIERDFAYSFKKIGSKKILFGSDHPFVDLDKSIIFHKYFFKKYKFSKYDIENVFYKNAKEILLNENVRKK